MFKPGDIVKDPKYGDKYIYSYDYYGNDLVLIDENGVVASKSDNDFDLFDDISVDYRKVIRVGKLKI